MSDPQRYVLGIAYQAGPDPKIRKGADGGRDFFTPEELESAAWYFAKSQHEVGIQHADGTEGAAEVTESYIYRGPDWPITNVAGETVIVKAGDWLIGAILDPVSWRMYQDGLLTGFSPQGSGRRVTPVAKATDTTTPTGPLAPAYGPERLAIDLIKTIVEGLPNAR